jgi:hypothetical protein
MWGWKVDKTDTASFKMVGSGSDDVAPSSTVMSVLLDFLLWSKQIHHLPWKYERVSLKTVFLFCVGVIHSHQCSQNTKISDRISKFTKALTEYCNLSNLQSCIVSGSIKFNPQPKGQLS